MASLQGRLHNDTYKDLLQVSNSNSGIDATLRVISDGEGTASALYISSNAIQVDNIKLDGNTISNVDVAGGLILSADGSITLTASGANVVVVSGNSTRAATVRFAEDTDTGVNYVDLLAPTLASNIAVTLPSSSGQLALVSQIGSTYTLVTEATPQLGGNLDTNGNNIAFDDTKGILDENANEQLIFTTTGSAVNYINITNAATGNPGILSVKGSDTNISLALQAKGTGAFVFKGTADSAAEIRLSEDTDNGTNYIGIKAPASVGSNVTFTLPSADGSTGQFLKTDGSGTLSFATQTQVNPNLLDNGGFRVCQRRTDGTAFTNATPVVNNDDTYLMDRWVNLVEAANTISVTQNTGTVPTGAYNSYLMTVVTGSKQFGLAQFVEARDTTILKGGVASFQFKARKGGANATMGIIRAAIIQWTGTGDAVTSDVVSSWAGSGTNPTLAANWAYASTPANITLTTSYQTVSYENVSISASATNVGVFIWCDDQNATIGDVCFVADCKLEASATATTFQPRGIAEELARCRRHYKLHSGTSTIQQAVNDPLRQPIFLTSLPSSSYFGSILFDAPMRTTPTVTVYPYATPANTGRMANSSGTDYGASSAVASNICPNGFTLQNSSGGALSITGYVGLLSFFASADL